MFTTRPELSGTFGAVASTHWLASASGLAILEAGGNAFDALVAAGFAAAVRGSPAAVRRVCALRRAPRPA